MMERRMTEQISPPQDTPPQLRPLFVETTAHVDLALGAPEVRRELEQLLAAHEGWSSRYVLMEFRRTAGHALDVARRLATIAPDDHTMFSWMLRAIDRGHGGQGRLLSPRERGRSRAAVYMAMEKLGRTPAVRAVVVGLLSATIQLVETLAWAGIKRVVDETDCDLVRPERLQGQRWPLSCNAQLAQCRQSIFLDHHRPELAAVLAECQADREFDDAKMLEVLRAIVSAVPLKATGQRRCWPLGDLIIGLEAHSAGQLLSSNGRHYGPICRALGVTLVTYSPYPSP